MGGILMGKTVRRIMHGFPLENTGKLCLRRDHSWSGRSLWKMIQLGLSTWISLELMIRVFFSISTEKNVMVSDS